MSLGYNFKLGVCYGIDDMHTYLLEICDIKIK